jgi:hypothetical protein
MRLTPNQCTLTQIRIFFIDSIESKVKQYQAFAKLLVGPNSTPVVLFALLHPRRQTPSVLKVCDHCKLKVYVLGFVEYQ